MNKDFDSATFLATIQDLAATNDALRNENARLEMRVNELLDANSRYRQAMIEADIREANTAAQLAVITTAYRYVRRVDELEGSTISDATASQTDDNPCDCPSCVVTVSDEEALGAPACEEPT